LNSDLQWALPEVSIEVSCLHSEAERNTSYPGGSDVGLLGGADADRNSERQRFKD
jgi:hypothetical protein